MVTGPVIDQFTLKTLLSYNRRTGVFKWKKRPGKKSWNTRYAGKVAGSKWTPAGCKKTYRVIRIFDYPFLAHRLVFLYVTGAMPPDDVDHLDDDGLNNKWANLRPATKSENGLNRGANANSKTGIKGVSPYGSRFRATVQINGKWKQIGVFTTLQAASRAYQKEIKKSAGKFGRSA